MDDPKTPKTMPPLILRDMAFHAAVPRKPKSWFTKIMDVFRSKKSAGRIYTKDIQVTRDGDNINVHFNFHTPPEVKKQMEEYKAKHGEYPQVLLPLDIDFPISFKEPLEAMRAKERRKWKKIDRFL